jgi:hypothetical protein
MFSFFPTCLDKNLKQNLTKTTKPPGGFEKTKLGRSERTGFSARAVQKHLKSYCFWLRNRWFSYCGFFCQSSHFLLREIISGDVMSKRQGWQLLLPVSVFTQSPNLSPFYSPDRSNSVGFSFGCVRKSEFAVSYRC